MWASTPSRTSTPPLAFTGWNLRITRGAADGDNTYSFIYNANQHETAPKTFSFPVYSDGSATIQARSASAGQQDGLDLINALSMHPETARRVAQKRRLLRQRDDSSAGGFIDQLAAVYLQNGLNIRPVLLTILTSPLLHRSGGLLPRYFLAG